jgi:hypothetical protein
MQETEIRGMGRKLSTPWPLWIHHPGTVPAPNSRGGARPEVVVEVELRSRTWWANQMTGKLCTGCRKVGKPLPPVGQEGPGTRCPAGCDLVTSQEWHWALNSSQPLWARLHFQRWVLRCTCQREKKRKSRGFPLRM